MHHGHCCARPPSADLSFWRHLRQWSCQAQAGQAQLNVVGGQGDGGVARTRTEEACPPWHRAPSRRILQVLECRHPNAGQQECVDAFSGAERGEVGPSAAALRAITEIEGHAQR